MERRTFLDELIRRQGASRNKEFAARLGISESYWSLIRRGERPLTLSVIQRAIREFPDLAPLFVNDLLPDVPQPGHASWAVPAGRAVRRFALKRLLVNGALAAAVAVSLIAHSSGVLSGSTPTIFANEHNKDDLENGQCREGKTLFFDARGKPHCRSIN